MIDSNDSPSADVPVAAPSPARATWSARGTPPTLADCLSRSLLPLGVLAMLSLVPLVGPFALPALALGSWRLVRRIS